MEAIFTVLNTASAVVKIRIEKNSCLYKLYFHYCLSSVQNCADWFHIQFFICSSQNDLHIFPVIYRVRVHNFQAFSVWLKMLIFLLWYLNHKKIISLWITVKTWLFLVVFRNLFHPSDLSTILLLLCTCNQIFLRS